MSVNIAFSVGVMSAMYLTKGITGENSCRNFILFYFTSLRTCLFKKNIFSLPFLFFSQELISTQPWPWVSVCCAKRPGNGWCPTASLSCWGPMWHQGWSTQCITVGFWPLLWWRVFVHYIKLSPVPCLNHPCIKCYATIITCSFNHGSNAKKIHDLHAVPLWARGGYRPHVEIFLYLLTLCSRCYHVV